MAYQAYSGDLKPPPPTPPPPQATTTVQQNDKHSTKRSIIKALTVLMGNLLF